MVGLALLECFLREIVPGESVVVPPALDETGEQDDAAGDIDLGRQVEAVKQ